MIAVTEMQISPRIISVAKTAGATGIARSVGLISSIAIIPMTVGYLGTEKFGVWMSLTSWLAFMQLADMGVGNGIIKLIASDRADNNGRTQRAILSAALIVTGSTAAAIFVILALLIGAFSVSWMFKDLPADLTGDADRTALVLAFLFCINVPLSSARSIRLGMMEGHKGAGFAVLGHILNIGLVVTAIFAQGEIEVIAACAFTGTVIGNLLNYYSIWRRSPKGAVPRRELFGYVNISVQRGLPYLALQLISTISTGIDVVIVSMFLGADSVATYTIAARLFAIPPAFAALFYSGLWGAYADASARGDWLWLKRTYVRSVLVALSFAVVASLTFSLISPLAYSLLSHGAIVGNPALSLAMATYAAFSITGGAIASLLNGLHLMRVQLLWSAAGTLVNVICSVSLVQAIGVSGPVWGSVIGVAISFPVLIVYSSTKLNEAATRGLDRAAGPG